MVVMAYLAGICTPFAALLGAWSGLAWWARLRRSEGRLTPEPGMVVYPPDQLPEGLAPKCGHCDWCRMGAMFCRNHAPPPPSSAQDDRITVGKVAYGRNVPRRRNVRGHRPGR